MAQDDVVKQRMAILSARLEVQEALLKAKLAEAEARTAVEVGHTTTQARTEIGRLKRGIGSMVEAHNKDKIALEARVSELERTLAGAKSKSEEEEEAITARGVETEGRLESLSTALRTAKADANHMKRQLEDSEETWSKALENAAATRSSVQLEIDRLHSEMAAMAKLHDAEMAGVKSDHRAEMASMVPASLLASMEEKVVEAQEETAASRERLNSTVSGDAEPRSRRSSEDSMDDILGPSDDSDALRRVDMLQTELAEVRRDAEAELGAQEEVHQAMMADAEARLVAQEEDHSAELQQAILTLTLTLTLIGATTGRVHSRT